MKRFPARFITVAALGCLLALWALPASAYYPPLHATVTVEPGKVGVTYKVYDPKLQKDVTYSQKYWENTVVDCKQDNGVIAWVFHHPAGYYFVYSCVYDPFQENFIEDVQGSFDSVSELTVKDGVVAYVVPSEVHPGRSAAIYATYDPLRGWMKSKYYEDWSIFTPSNFSVLTQDGLVVFLSQESASDSFHILFDIYDPYRGVWVEGYHPGGPSIHEFYGTGLNSLYIDKATLYFTKTTTDIFGHTTTISYVVGYEPNYDMTFLRQWSYISATPHLAYFVAQPTSGSSPLWVWFTDMSIAGTTWNWSFGDNTPPSTSRSPYHTFTSPGNYKVSQQIDMPSFAYNQTIIVGYPTVLKKSLTGVLYLLLLAD